MKPQAFPDTPPSPPAKLAGTLGKELKCTVRRRLHVRCDSSATTITGDSVKQLAQASISLPQRDGSVTVSEVIDAYMLQYSGCDTTRHQRLRFWQMTLGH